MPRLVHLADRARWEDARASGAYLPAEFATDGFIHLSALHQVLTPANRFYRGRDDLIAIVVDALLIDHALVWEPGTGTDEYFPHLYGALGTDAVLAEIPFQPETDGSFLLPPRLTAAVRRNASPTEDRRLVLLFAGEDRRHWTNPELAEHLAIIRTPPQVLPPSTAMVCPVIHDDSGRPRTAPSRRCRPAPRYGPAGSGTCSRREALHPSDRRHEFRTDDAGLDRVGPHAKVAHLIGGHPTQVVKAGFDTAIGTQAAERIRSGDEQPMIEPPPWRAICVAPCLMHKNVPM